MSPGQKDNQAGEMISRYRISFSHITLPHFQEDFTGEKVLSSQYNRRANGKKAKTQRYTVLSSYCLQREHRTYLKGAKI
jgi:hypothetical protein